MSCRHRPYEGSQLDDYPYGFRLRCSRHRPYEGSQHGADVDHAADAVSRHRPYEGSQHGRQPAETLDQRRVVIAPTRGRNTWPTWTCPQWSSLRSSSPLRGVATRVRVGAVNEREVVIAPTRGRNYASSSISCTPTLSRHRPYEGSQPDQRADVGRRGRVVIAPTRGRNARSSTPRSRRPRSSSPLRGVATPDGHPGAGCGRGRHRPYEGSQRLVLMVNMGGLNTGRHRPYEGSQPLRLHGVERLFAGVVIAPTRGRNTNDMRRHTWSSSRHRPYEGSQLEELPALRPSGAMSSSPLRGVATR